MMIKKLAFTTALFMGLGMSAHAADDVHQLDFKRAVQSAIADGTLDGSVKFYLAGTNSGGRALQKGVVTNKKTNGFMKSAEESCDWVLRSALIQLQTAAKQQGANAVINIVSYYKSNETRSTTTYECHKGTAMAGVALKGDLAKF
ncbi:excinuclease [Acinetobacter sp. ANC 4635]|uniref:excinuclease n=1 Tax=Acinetobacter sp. ANC 4635 TaxID=2529846 RepID=UPI00103DFD01|nr:excinuclease [Acinetobacter sp. ANC 4635]TCB31592.1 excinuclease [Acinetobacter sp. ANC 4635]